MSDRTELSKDALSGTTTGYVVDPGTGEELETTFKDITESEQQKLESLENAAMDGDEGANEELHKTIINEYCLNDITYSDVGVATRQAIFVGFLRALGDTNEATQQAQEFFDAVGEGNR